VIGRPERTGQELSGTAGRDLGGQAKADQMEAAGIEPANDAYRLSRPLGQWRLDVPLIGEARRAGREREASAQDLVQGPGQRPDSQTA
jgi:hypothetical protein